MKTFNINMKSVVIVALSFIATSVNVNAQAKLTKADQDHIQDQKDKVAFVVGALKGKANCFEYGAPTVVDGFVTEVEGTRHNRVKISPYIGASFIHGESDDLGNQNVNSTTGGVSFEFVNHKKDAFAGLYLSVDAEINSSVTVENLKTTAFGLFANGGVTFNPCGKLQATVAGTLGYLNSTSQRYVKNDAVEGNIDYKGNPLYIGGMAKISYPIFSISSSKIYTVKGQQIKGTKKNPVELFVKGRIGTTEISKPKVDNKTFTWNGLRATVALGLSFTM
jgi:hypothetical protein